MHIKRALSPVQKVDSAVTVVEHESKDDEDEKLLTEMEDLTNAMERKKNRAKKLLSKRQAKDKARKATGMQVDAMQDGYIDHDLFSLSSIKGKKDLVAVDCTDFDDDEDDNLGDSEHEGIHEEAKEEMSSDMDSDEERRRYDDQLEEHFDQVHDQFVAETDGSTKQRKRARQSYAEDGQLLEGGDNDSVIHSDHDSDNDDGDHDANPLMILEEREVLRRRKHSGGSARISLLKQWRWET